TPDLYAARGGIEHLANRRDASADVDSFIRVDFDRDDLTDCDFAQVPLRQIDHDPCSRRIGDDEQWILRIGTYFGAGIHLPVRDDTRDWSAHRKPSIVSRRSRPRVQI